MGPVVPRWAPCRPHEPCYLGNFLPSTVPACCWPGAVRRQDIYRHSNNQDQVPGSPDSKVHGANMGPTWDLSAPDGPRVGLMNLAIRVGTWKFKRCGCDRKPMLNRRVPSDPSSEAIACLAALTQYMCCVIWYSVQWLKSKHSGSWISHHINHVGPSIKSIDANNR